MPIKTKWSVPRLWPEATVVCICAGPSLTRADVEIVRGWRLASSSDELRRVVVVNRAWEFTPWADLLYAADARFYRFAQNAPGFAGLKVCGEEIEYRDVAHVGMADKPGLSLDPAALHNGGNSGYQALNLAVLAGARRTILLGYDLQVGPNGESHAHEDYPANMNNPKARTLRDWCDAFATLPPDLRRAGVEVINATRQSALSCFPRRDLAAALRRSTELVAP